MPGLPFPDASFDAVAAGFVISHLASHVDGLTEMVRVCKSGGRVGVTTWGTLPNPAGTLWKEVATTSEGGERLTDEFCAAVPWGDWFTRPANLEYALREARLIHVTTIARDFVVSVAVEDYLAMKGATVEGTLLRRMLTAERWDRFTHEVMEAFRTRFGDVVEFTRDFLIGLGTKP
jgi:SAM-dependent methyltransferase